MEITASRRKFNVTEADRIVDIGIVDGRQSYILHSESSRSIAYVNPQVSKAIFKKLLKDGKIRKLEEKCKGLFGEYDQYGFVEVADGHTNDNI